MYQGSTCVYIVGDRINIRDKVKTKIKEDGSKTLIPSIKASHIYNIRATITKARGHTYDA